MSFSTDLVKRIGPALAKLGFYDLPKWGKFSHQVIFVKAVDEEMAAYLHCRNPRGTEDIRMRFWVAPLDLPDDGTFNMQTGGHVLVLESSPPWDGLLEGAVQRVEELIQQIPEMAAGVRYELENPQEQMPRLPIYLGTRQIYRRAPSLMPAEVWTKLEAAALKRNQGRLSGKKLDELTWEIVTQYLAEAAKEELPNKTIQIAASTFTSHLLAHALLKQLKMLEKDKENQSS